MYRSVEKWKASYVEMHIDIEGRGLEFSSGHCWLPDKARDLIWSIKNKKIIDGKGKKTPNRSELFERKFRADPVDGLRPIRKFR